MSPDAFLDLARARWSPYLYAETPVPDGVLETLFEAMRWAPSSRNEQPWRLVVGAKGEGTAYDRVLATLAPPNQQWARHAPVLGVAFARTAFRRNDRPNGSALHDVGAAMMLLGLAATAHGLQLHQMGGFDGEAARMAFSAPEGYAPAVAFALGTPADSAPDVPEPYAVRDQTRRGRLCLADLVFTEDWDAPRWPEAQDGCDDEGA